MSAEHHIDLLWMLLCSVLVLFMQAGFLAIEAGLTRTKNSINVAIKNLTDFALAAAVFTAFGFGMMFGPSTSGWFGDASAPNLDGGPMESVFFFYQLMFCGAAVTLVSGAVAERMRFSGYVAVATFIAGPVYSVVGHWVWNGAIVREHTGWLGQAGFVDFAGATVVHSVGGWAALALVILIGPRSGRYDAQGRVQEIPGSNQPMAMLGTILLWIGWFGFNGGGTFALTDNVPHILVNTVLAACSGLLVGVFAMQSLRGSVRPAGASAGSLAGLVAVTGGCHAFTAVEAIFIGAVGCVLCLASEAYMERKGLDDVVGAVPIHGVGGAWGTLAVALFGDSAQLETGLSFGQQVAVQTLGIVVTFVWSFGLTYIACRAYNRYFPIRVSSEAEQLGLNVVEHGARNELAVLLGAMHKQADSSDLSARAPVEPFTEIGQIASLYNHVLDSLQQAVARTDAIVRQIRQGIVTISHSGTLLQVNPGGERLFGAPATTLVGQQATNLLSFEGDAQPAPWCDDISHTEQLHEMVVTRQDGSRIPVEVSVAPSDVDGDIKCTALVADIRERKRAQANLTEALRSAQEASRAKSEFLATMSHEIRTPMNGVLGMTEILLDTPLSGEQRSYAKTVKQSAQALLTIINDILDFSKVEAGKMTLDPTTFDPYATLSAVVELQRPQAEGKLLKLELRSDHLPRLVGDEGRIRQVLMNLVGNAIKFTEQGSVTVVASISPELNGVHELTIAVQDTGIGIASDKIDHVFETFTQAESSTTRRFGGTGLGLSICYKLARLMGGDIAVDSAPQSGSTFTLALPLARAESQTPSHQVVDPRVLQFDMRLLVAEDNVINQRVAKKFFERLGCDVTLVNNGQEAVAIANERSFDAIFMDCQMPVVDGYEATRRIREQLGRGSPPIIAMTANAMQGDRERCLDCGMVDFVSKPVNLEALQQVLARHQPEASGSVAPPRQVRESSD